VLLSFNGATILWAFGSVGLVVLYPFMKRITDWPQAVLGMAFNWGALLGWTASYGQMGWPALVLWGAGLCWTLGYDTIYAHQDKDDDARIGVRSTALRFGARTRRWIAGFYAATLLLLVAAGWGAGLPVWAVSLSLIGAGLHFLWQLAWLRIDDPASCLLLFRANRFAGAAILLPWLAAGVFA
jgi:4-hydroxybenzoate polyprenyltransferase